MNETNTDKKRDIICHCTGTTEEKIKELIDSGFDSLDKLSRQTGACSGCGACETPITDLLAAADVEPLMTSTR
ncbi:MAG: (2Fe-2S)-binding protein [Methylicorpusculum sp.]|uniref:(2Fe-2S)-binding protein n=1 Tax=Methylicorpusculum sp. TaxID=2713644 RepID=UPI00272778E7|nr:(2Fe-2S)-binding protein [Methylicorpusculum sp.]MDO8940127.1 (2Fe-2S)-binding protein [Methylicorpusculum sp.]MDP2200727.1 (2Fe-2S)-binding protein [Methylicorpusculum sp.]